MLRAWRTLQAVWVVAVWSSPHGGAQSVLELPSKASAEYDNRKAAAPTPAHAGKPIVRGDDDLEALCGDFMNDASTEGTSRMMRILSSSPSWSCSPTMAPTMLHESDANATLVALYAATGGANDRWINSLNWGKSGEGWGGHCAWYGVNCTQAGQIRGLHLTDNFLVGGLPTEIGYLTTLEALDVSQNFMNGSVPTELGRLSEVRDLRLGSMISWAWSATIPSELGMLTAVAGDLDLSKNHLGGEIPTELGQLSLVDGALELQDNFLTGTLPKALHLLTAMRTLEVQNNFLEGPVPTLFSRLSSLKRLDVSGNTYICGPNSSFPANATFNATGTMINQACCPKGHFWNATNSTLKPVSVCTPCPDGTFADTPGATSCSACPGGSFASSAGSSNCTNCPVGKSSFATAAKSASTCRWCAANSYAAQAGSANCTGCPRGTFNRSLGASSAAHCGLCRAGTYGVAGLGKGCADCDAGTASSAVGATRAEDCSSCGSGRFAPAGSPSCRSCAPGYYATNNATDSDAIGEGVGASLCRECPGGRYNGKNDSIGCKVCAAGKASSAASTHCTSCVRGKYSAFGAAACSDCEAGKISAAAGATSCSACPAGYYAAAAGQWACAACPTGTYVAYSGASACADCPAGTAGNGATASSACSSCAAGRFANATGLVACRACTAGSFAAGHGNYDCADCVAGRYSRRAADRCLNCERGYYSGQNASHCSSCAPGTFSGEEGAAVCSPCSVGKYQPSEAMASCYSCIRSLGIAYSSPPAAANCSICAPAFYMDAERGPAGECFACPRGTDCSRYGCSLHRLPLRKGWYRFRDGSTAVHRCPYPKNCQGGNRTGDAICAEGAEGPLCAVCSKKHTMAERGRCVECSAEVAFTSPPLMVLMAFAAVLAMVYLKVDIVIKTCMPVVSDRIADFFIENEYFVAVVLEKLSVVAVTIQTVLLLAWNQKAVGVGGGGAEAAFPDVYNRVLTLFSFVTADLASFLPVGCFDDFGYISQLLTMTGAYFAFIFFCMLSYAKANAKNDANNHDDAHSWRWRMACITVTRFFLPALTRNLAMGLRCETYDNGRKAYLLVNPSVDCDAELFRKGEVGLIAVLVLLVAIPFLLAFNLLRVVHLLPEVAHEEMHVNGGTVVTVVTVVEGRENIDRHHVLGKTSLQPLFRDLKPRFWYFEVVDLSMRLALTTLTTRFGTAEEVLLFAVALVVVHSTLLHHWQPYRDQGMNTVKSQQQLLVLLSLVALIGRAGDMFGSSLYTDYTAVGTVLACLLAAMAVFAVAGSLDRFNEQSSGDIQTRRESRLVKQRKVDANATRDSAFGDVNPMMMGVLDEQTTSERESELVALNSQLNSSKARLDRIINQNINATQAAEEAGYQRVMEERKKAQKAKKKAKKEAKKEASSSNNNDKNKNKKKTKTSDQSVTSPFFGLDELKEDESSATSCGGGGA